MSPKQRLVGGGALLALAAAALALLLLGLAAALGASNHKTLFR